MADQANACQQRAELFPELVIFDLHNRFSLLTDLHHSAEIDPGALEDIRAGVQPGVLSITRHPAARDP